MKLVGYARVSSDEQDTSIENQLSMIESFCEESGEGEFSGPHQLAGVHWDENVSGSTRPSDRPGFAELMACLEQDEDIEGIVVKSFSRLSRDIEQMLAHRVIATEYNLDRDLEILQVTPWTRGRRSLPHLSARLILEAEDIQQEANDAMVFIFSQLLSQWEIIESSKRIRRGLEEKQKRGEPIGRPPFGLTTDKQKLGTEKATEYLPDDEFDTAIEVLNEYGKNGSSSYELAQRFDLSSSALVDRLWENRDIYREIAESRRPELEIGF